MVEAIIAPSLLAADAGNLRCECGRVLDAGADWLHIDIMDGHFVPNLSFFDVANIRHAIPKGKAVLDIHMMVSDPAKWIDLMAKNGADSYTFHYEAIPEGQHAKIIKQVKDAGMNVACALKPDTPAEVVDAFAEDLDMILVMTVEPGFGGQKFMRDMMPKVNALRRKYPGKHIQVDGGLSASTIGEAAEAGANVIVAGTGIFKADDASEAVKTLRDAVEHAQTKSKF
ncbi:Ribulose-phosphate 3-epimerase-like protein [Protomyces lactucae-debilis]|uniref:Ribulose-phosphate 3-epimerase n=1 Tax=Protomyces lactucae-debilis TaxID=2754530 RepID=A0A1Y2F6K6_PROLT|nr:Ribulose-phosphate 3-epimerase-like protein [Protomyces lactucae-debilis]ORY79511.1 Ribulose-phosphate 3-epimerase-like protein [Protomyces lactucae-debilis]